MFLPVTQVVPFVTIPILSSLLLRVIYTYVHICMYAYTYIHMCMCMCVSCDFLVLAGRQVEALKVLRCAFFAIVLH